MKHEISPRLLDVKVFSDDRGCLIPFSNALAADLTHADFPTPKRAYVVYNYRAGVIRGLHYHEHEWKYFFVANGAAKFIAIDPEESEERHVFVASSRRPAVVMIPPLYANGWISLEDQTILFCLSSSTFEESAEDDRRYDPFTWGDVWSVKPR